MGPGSLVGTGARRAAARARRNGRQRPARPNRIISIALKYIGTGDILKSRPPRRAVPFAVYRIVVGLLMLGLLFAR
jgi:hypothetical protein